ncbi:MAG: acyl-CoA dehydratase activase [Peptococcaceae bacterium]|jgi:predicted CoA-substrate-specific enzyme activase|nr:acyl-CoA dehydratase activase [Peptococcaceae bacterium]
MITAGIDMGIEYVKAVVLKDGKVAGRGIGLSGGARRSAAAETALEDALKEAGFSRGDLEKIIATGKGKFDLVFVDKQVTEAVAAASAVKALCPEATCVMNAGCDETLVVTFTGDGKIQQPALNEKCAAGVGGFLQNMARRLELSLDEMSALPPVAEGGAAVNDGCVVFAELDALSLLSQGKSPEEIASAVTDAAAIRACTVISDITIPAFARVVLLGGLTKNKAFVRALEARAGFDFVIPEEAEYAGAFGAALIAAG